MNTEDMTPDVVNIRHESTNSDYVYVGRGGRYNGRYHPRSPLANPFTVKKLGRLGAIAEYKKWLWERMIMHDQSVLKAIAEIPPYGALGCHCKPAPCHGDVIANAWRWLFAGKHLYYDKIWRLKNGKG